MEVFHGLLVKLRVEEGDLAGQRSAASTQQKRVYFLAWKLDICNRLCLLFLCGLHSFQKLDLIVLVALVTLSLQLLGQALHIAFEEVVNELFPALVVLWQHTIQVQFELGLVLNHILKSRQVGLLHHIKQG